jgi:hypothetical protein
VEGGRLFGDEGELPAEQRVLRLQREGGGLPAAQALVLLAQAGVLLRSAIMSGSSATRSRTVRAGSAKAA